MLGFERDGAFRKICFVCRLQQVFLPYQIRHVLDKRRHSIVDTSMMELAIMIARTLLYSCYTKQSEW